MQRADPHSMVSSNTNTNNSLKDPTSRLRQYERALIDAALQVAEGNVSKAARLLNISRTTLYSRMEAREKARA